MEQGISASSRPDWAERSDDALALAAPNGGGKLLISFFFCSKEGGEITRQTMSTLTMKSPALFDATTRGVWHQGQTLLLIIISPKISSVNKEGAVTRDAIRRERKQLYNAAASLAGLHRRWQTHTCLISISHFSTQKEMLLYPTKQLFAIQLWCRFPVSSIVPGLSLQ